MSAVRARQIEQNNISSAEGFLLAREGVVRFVQDSIAHAVGRQKRNADKNIRAMFFYVLKAIYSSYLWYTYPDT